MYLKYVVYEPSLGVFLAQSGPYTYWSNVDCIGIDRATVFELQDGLKFILRHDKTTKASQSILIPVPAHYDASSVPMGTCIAAGLPGWNYMMRRMEIMNPSDGSKPH